MDFIVGLPTVPAEGTPWQIKGHKEYNAMMTVSCKNFKWSRLIPRHDAYTAEDWGEALMRQLLLSDWGVSSAIISDRDRKFASDFWKDMWKALGTKLLMTAAYHPQGDGLVERKNQTVEIALRFFLFERPDANWTDIIPLAQWNLNSGYSEPIKSSPHEQLFGFKPAGPLEALTRKPASPRPKTPPSYGTTCFRTPNWQWTLLQPEQRGATTASIALSNSRKATWCICDCTAATTSLANRPASSLNNVLALSR